MNKNKNTEAKYSSRNYKKREKLIYKIHEYMINHGDKIQFKMYRIINIPETESHTQGLEKNTGDNSTQFQIYTHIYIHIHTHICTHIYYAVKHKANFSSDGCKTTSLVRLFHSPTVLGKNEYVKQLLRV